MTTPPAARLGASATPPLGLQLFSGERHLTAAMSWLLLSPVLVLFLAIFAVPVLGMARFSLFDPDFTFENYRLLFSEPLFLRVIWRTLWISAAVAAITLLLGYPVAALMVRLRGWKAFAIGACVLVPLWLSILVRSYAWVVLLARNGIVTSFLRELGLIDETTKLMFTDGAVILAMSHVLLPFMILPLYASLNAIPKDLAPAAHGLGASHMEAFFRVTLQLSMPGVFAGLVLVFVLSLGFFVTPQLVGGPNSMMASMLISREATYGDNWGLASSLSTVLFVCALCVVAVVARFTASREALR
ncbi:ABC transporter permease [Pelagibius sp.]|uniref:ABC transporter permease n=1 Tax=Pelagibius sp. TaxID=1931238 RepID=UPI003BB0375C